MLLILIKVLSKRSIYDLHIPFHRPKRRIHDSFCLLTLLDHRSTIRSMLTRIITKHLFSTPLFPYWLAWQEFWSTWAVLERYSDLERLVDWAHRKRLAGIRNHYQNLLVETEILLAHKQMKRRNLVFWTRELYLVYRSLIAKPKYYPKGGAEQYRLRLQ